LPLFLHCALQVDLCDFYAGVPRNARYRLCSMVCHYAALYTAFVWADDLSAWLMFDDTHVTRVGAWADVRRKCEAARIQPSMLFYEGQP
jgi:ubiquitin C-terminal hydrolase